MTTRKRRLRDYGPIQMGNRLGLQRFQIERAISSGLIPRPDAGNGRWLAATVDALAGRADGIREATGAIPDLGACRAAAVLSERFGTDVPPGAMLELDRLSLIPVTGDYKGCELYDGHALEHFRDHHTLQQAIRDGRLHTADEAAERLNIRRCDFGHLTRAGWIEPITRTHSRWQRRCDYPAVPLFRAVDLDVLAAHPAIDWDAVRATPPGRPSPLARLTKQTARKTP